MCVLDFTFMVVSTHTGALAGLGPPGCTPVCLSSGHILHCVGPYPNT